MRQYSTRRRVCMRSMLNRKRIKWRRLIDYLYEHKCTMRRLWMSWNVRSKWTATMTVPLHLIALSQSTDDTYIHPLIHSYNVKCKFQKWNSENFLNGTQRNVTFDFPFISISYASFISLHFILFGFYAFIACIYSYCTSESQTFIFYSLIRFSY